jgi:hypothetical protein
MSAVKTFPDNQILLCSLRPAKALVDDPRHPLAAPDFLYDKRLPHAIEKRARLRPQQGLKKLAPIVQHVHQRGLPERLKQPRDFDGDPSRLVLRQHLRPPRFGFAPSGVDVCERLPVGAVNPVRRPAAMRNIGEWMEHVIARAGSKSGTPSRRRLHYPRRDLSCWFLYRLIHPWVAIAQTSAINDNHV